MLVPLGFYLSILILLVSAVATALCLTSYGLFRHRAAFWLSLCVAGLFWFALAILVSGFTSSLAKDASVLGPRGLGLLWQALGSVFVVHALPRFLFSAFGSKPSRVVYRLLDSATVVVALLSVFRVAGGWTGLPAGLTLPSSILRIFLFAFIGGALVLTLIFQSRLPDRSLYKAVIFQIGAFALLLPFVFLEDLGLFVVPGLPYLAGQFLLAAASLAAVVHARRSLMRPKYVAGNAPSPYFVERFGISERELEVVKGVLDGFGNNEIAERLFISPRTVEKHLYNVYQKAEIKNRLQLYNLLRSDAD